jgi:adenylate cyclase
MVLEEFFNANKVLDLSFFNFQNSVTAAYFANSDYNVMRVNQNFNDFFQHSVIPKAFTFLKFLRL